MSSYRQRQARIRSWLEEAAVDAIMVSSPANVRYLSGFTGEGHLILTAEAGAICSDSRFQIEAEQADGLAIAISPNGHLEAAAEFLNSEAAGKLAFEEHVLTYSQFRKLEKAFGTDGLEPVSGVVEEQRIIKDAGEVSAIRKAAQTVDTALTELLAEVQPGPTEKELAIELDHRILLNGADTIAFPTIAASGPSAACPHAQPTDRRLAEGDMLKIDVGCCLEGYCSDMTRTIFLGEPDERFSKIYSVVLAAQQAALEQVGPGVTCAQLDKIARDVVQAAGFGEYFIHGLGHGVGLEVHEAPRVSARSDEVLAAGMVITVEPGIYIEGWGGVRIEDLVVVTEDGCEILSKTPKLRY